MYYSDNNSWPSQISDLNDYMDRSVGGTTIASYDVASASDGTYFIEAELKDSANSGLRTKLKEMAEDSGLYASATSSSDLYQGGSDNTLYVRLGN